MGGILGEKEASPWPHRVTVLVLLGAYLTLNVYHHGEVVSAAQRHFINSSLYMHGQSWGSKSFLVLVVVYVGLAAYILSLPGAWRSRTRQGRPQVGVFAATGMALLLLVFEATLLATAVGRLVPVEGSSSGGTTAMSLDNPLALIWGLRWGLGVAAFQLLRMWPVNSRVLDQEVEAYQGTMGKRDVKRMLRTTNAAKQGANAHRIGAGVAAGTLVGFLPELVFHFWPAARNSSLFGARAELIAYAVPVLGLLAGLLVSFLWKSVRSSEARRSASLILDVVMFWPRAAHPWGVPWAGRRAVSEVSERLSALTSAGEVVLWAHSQGTVIAVAALSALTPEQRAHVALITCGSPLRTLYSQHFPAYWNPSTTQALARDLGIWENYFRATDFVGRRVYFEDEHPRDHELPDPSIKDAANRMRKPLVHSYYWSEPTILDRVRELVTG